MPSESHSGVYDGAELSASPNVFTPQDDIALQGGNGIWHCLNANNPHDIANSIPDELRQAATLQMLLQWKSRNIQF